VANVVNRGCESNGSEICFLRALRAKSSPRRPQDGIFAFSAAALVMTRPLALPGQSRLSAIIAR
jgi:hypothetical protein